MLSAYGMRTFFRVILRLQLFNLIIRAERLEIVSLVEVIEACDELLRELWKWYKVSQPGQSRR